MKKPVEYYTWSFASLPGTKPTTCPINCERKLFGENVWEEVWDNPKDWRWDYHYRWPKPKKPKAVAPKEVYEDPEVRVTKIGKRWHSRLIYKGKVVDEMACQYAEDIGLICKEMLRWFDKMGNISKYADKARHRQSTVRPYKGKTWSRVMLDAEKAKRKAKENYGKV